MYMRSTLLSTSALLIILGLAGTAAAQDTASSALPKIKEPVADHWDLMSPSGRIAQIVSRSRASQPNHGIGRAWKASIHPGDPDFCIAGDEDCSNEGFSEAPGGGFQSEISIAVDVTGQHIVVGYNDFRGFAFNPQSLSGFSYSDNGGTTFTDGGQLPITSNGMIGTTKLPQVDGDPVILYIPGGAGCQFVYASILVKGLTGTPPNFTGTAQSMAVHRSVDCGHTWTGPFEVTAATNPTGVLVGAGGNARDAADKEWMDVDLDTGRVIMAWSNFTASSVIPGGVQIRTTFSDNIMSASPPTWSAGVVVNPGAATFDTGTSVKFAANGSNNAYVAYSNSSFVAFANNVSLAVSTDNGVSWGAPFKLSASDYFSPDYILGNDRIHSFPSVTVDNSAGANKNNVYVVAASNNNSDGSDIQFWKSTNNGGTFSPGILLNARPGSDRSQWFPYITVDNTNGRIAVMYDDEGIAANGDVMEMSWIYSDDGAATWSKPSPLSVRPFHAGYGNDTGQPNLGDYNGAVAQNGKIYAAFAYNPPLVRFDDGQATAFPSFFTVPTYALATATGAKAAVNLGALSFTDSGGNGFIDAGDQIKLTIPLRNYVTNATTGTITYSSVSATLSTSTAGVTLQRATSAYPNIAPGATQNDTQQFVFTLASNFVPGTKLDFSLAVTTNSGTTALPFTLNTGTPVPTTVFSENFNSVVAPALPAGWAPIHAGGANTVPWVTNATFCGTSSNGLFHQNANDGGGNTRFERVTSPNIVIPANAQYVTIDFDICYDTEDDPSFNVLAYDGADLRITDFTAGHFARAAFVEGYAETFTTGSFNHYPKHTPRSSNGNYFQDISLWSGDSGGFKHVSMRIPGMEGTTVQLRPDYTQDSFGTCADVRPGHACGVIIDNIVVKSVVTKSDELAKILLTPVAGQLGTWNGVVTSQPIASAGGITVNLTSSLPAMTTISPSTVVIPAGSQTSPGFTVTLDPSAAGTLVIITATGPSNARSAGIQR